MRHLTAETTSFLWLFFFIYIEIFGNLQGDPLERRKSRRVLYNLKMRFWGFISAHIDHKYWTFDYLHQGSCIFYFKIQ